MGAEGSDFTFNAGARRAKPMLLRFADGEHAVPAWVVAEMGEATLLAIAADLAQHTFEEFSTSFSRQIASERMERIQSSFVAAHFGVIKQ